MPNLNGFDGGKIALLVVGGIVLLLAILWGVRRYQAYAYHRQLEALTEELRQGGNRMNLMGFRLVATYFLDDLEDGTLEDAYEKTTSALKARLDRRAFDLRVQREGLVGAKALVEGEEGQPAGQRGAPRMEQCFQFRRRTAAGRIISIRVELQKEEDQKVKFRVSDWSVSDVGIDAPDGPAPAERE